MLETFALKNKKILITGSMGLIGKSLSETLLKNGNEIIMIDFKINKKDEYFIDLKKKKIPIFDIDLSNKKKLINFFQKQKKILKGLNTIVNLAAIDRKIGSKKLFQTSFHNFEAKLLKQSIDNNLIGAVNICQESCKFFIKNKIKKANIINIASTYSLVSPNPNLYDKKQNKPVDYIISKGSIPILSKYIATNYAKQDIRCNCLIPHAVIKNPSKKFMKKFAELSPIGRICSVQEIIDPLIFLISDGSSYMTGSSLVVDGGWTAW